MRCTVCSWHLLSIYLVLHLFFFIESACSVSAPKAHEPWLLVRVVSLWVCVHYTLALHSKIKYFQKHPSRHGVWSLLAYWGVFVTICVSSKPKHMLWLQWIPKSLHLQTSESLFAFYSAPLGKCHLINCPVDCCYLCQLSWAINNSSEDNKSHQNRRVAFL